MAASSECPDLPYRPSIILRCHQCAFPIARPDQRVICSRFPIARSRLGGDLLAWCRQAQNTLICPISPRSGHPITDQGFRSPDADQGLI
eukprot:2066256-Lingulodinium_polyedra.AAC.1